MMKIHKNYWYLLFPILILGMTGCQSDEIKEQTDSMIKNSVITASSAYESKEEPANGDIYINIIDQYADAVNDNFFHNILSGESNDWNSIGKDVNINLLSNSRDYSHYEVYYALKDINGDGIPELFIGGSGGTDPLLIYDMFTFNQNRVINPFSESGYEFGNRTQLNVYKSGVFEVDWSNSGMNNGMDFYKFSEPGCLELLESVSLNKAPNEALKYYHDDKGSTEISKAAFDSILKHYRDLGRAELPWAKITEK